MRALQGITLAVAAAHLACPARGGTDLPADFVEEEILDGLVDPSVIAFAPDGRLFIAERIQGRLRVAHHDPATDTWAINSEPFYSFDIPADAEGNPERHNSSGLRGFAFDPEFAANGSVYCFYMKNRPRHNRVVRIQADPENGDLALPGELLLLDLPFHRSESSGSHNGGAVVFGPDGRLYVSTGDGWNGGDDVQSLSTFTGKIFRIESDGRIPDDNPFFTEASGAYRAIYALGLRNPFSMSRHPVSGEVYVNDVAGGNKANVFRLAAAANCGHDGYGGVGEPVGAWVDAGTGGGAGRVLSGGAWYPIGGSFPASYHGAYFTSLWGGNGSSTGGLSTVASEATPEVSGFASGIGHPDPRGALKPISLAVGPDGDLYYLASSYEAESGKVFRIRYVSCADIDGDGVVDVSDLIELIQAWGACPPPETPCSADLNDDGAVNVPDLLQLILGWGACG